MSRPRLRAGLLSLLALGSLLAPGVLLVPPARAGGTTTTSSDDDAAALVRLQRAAAASGTVAFAGTKVVTTWTDGQASSVVLAIGQDPDGARDVTARDTAGAALGSTALDEQRAGADPQDALRLLADGYQVRVDGPGAVAGRGATVVLAERAGREAARVWVDDATGLPLRQEVYDDAGLLRRLTTFTDLRLAPAAATTVAPAEAAPAGAWPDVVPLTSLDGWREDGWPSPATLPGGLRLVGARQSDTSSGPVLQLTYSDGIDDASLFVQRGVLDASGLGGWTGQDWAGSPVHVSPDGEGVVWQGRDAVFTLVTDAPKPTEEQIVATFPAPDEGGVVDSVIGAGRAVGGFFASAGSVVVGWMT